MDKYHLYTGEDKQQRMRAIIITVVFAVIILGLAVWAIVAIVGSSKNKSVLGTEAVSTADIVTTTDNDTKNEEVADPTPTTTNTEPTKEETQAETTTTTPAQDIPQTGPEEVLPLILIAGMLVTYLTSKKLNLNEA